jgi:hypothetical protein
VRQSGGEPSDVQFVADVRGGHVAVHCGLGRVVCRSHVGRADAIREDSHLRSRSCAGSIDGKIGMRAF